MRRPTHPLAGKTVRLRVVEDDPDHLNGQECHIEDWWDNVAGKSWMLCDGNPACLKYGIPSRFGDLPTDNEVVYGKVDGLGHLIHVSELGMETEAVDASTGEDD